MAGSWLGCQLVMTTHFQNGHHSWELQTFPWLTKPFLWLLWPIDAIPWCRSQWQLRGSIALLKVATDWDFKVWQKHSSQEQLAKQGSKPSITKSASSLQSYHFYFTTTALWCTWFLLDLSNLFSIRKPSKWSPRSFEKHSRFQMCICNWRCWRIASWRSIGRWNYSLCISMMVRFVLYHVPIHSK